ncbi:hypothetical protein JCM10213_002096 [Rhodosporidiobolus nylandii]
MSAPRTPQKPRQQSPLSPAARTATPGRAATPAGGRAKGGGGGAASPQVKAALAALRKQRQASNSSSLNNASPASAAEGDPFSTPERGVARPDSAARSASAPGSSAASSPARSRTGDGEVQLEWAVKGEDKLIEDAKRSGRLNLASRTLTSVPSSVYFSLLPRSSSYHPSHRAPSSYRRDPQPDLTISSVADEAEQEARWYEQQELKSLNLSSNEIGELGEEVGGFEDLEVLDLHNNQLSSLPFSLGQLVHLTALNLSHNRLASFPLQLLNLRHLRELHLSGNALTHLWPAPWREALEDALKPPGASPSATPESPENGTSFWESFPSSPFHHANRPSAALPHPSQSRAPFPLLQTLSVAENPLAKDALLDPDFELPSRLVKLDLSECGLTDAALPPALLGRLRALQDLDLSGNELADDLFSADLFPSSAAEEERLFPALRTLDTSRNPVDSLASLESFLIARVSRPIAYVGLPKPVQNLIHAEERAAGRRVGVPEGGEGGVELEVKVRECLMREEQVRRRRQFPASETSKAREAELAASRASSPAPAPKRAPSPRRRTPSPSPPPSPSPGPPPALAPASTTTPQKKPVQLEDWELEAAAGLSTPAGRRRAAAQAAKEKRERRERETAEREREAVEREREEERRREKEKEERGRDMVEREKRDAAERRKAEEDEELTEKMASARLADDDADDGAKVQEAHTPDDSDDSVSPPPYSPRPSSPTPATPAASSTVLPSHTSFASPHAAPAPAPANDPAVLLISTSLSPLSNGRSSLVLSSRSLASLPIPSGAPPVALVSPNVLDLSRNVLPACPLRGIEAWGWGAQLRTLNLSRNRVAALEMLQAESEGALMPQLETLDLSHNLLPSVLPSPFPSSSGVDMPLLSALAALAPSLVTLNLQRNRLTSLSGISALLFPPAGKGVKELVLSENKIADLAELCEVGEQWAKAKAGSERWRLEELDLSSNEISRIPPQLGYLPPTLVLHLTGNTFRIPRREVYENAAERRVVMWCREWLENIS